MEGAQQQPHPDPSGIEFASLQSPDEYEDEDETRPRRRSSVAGSGAGDSGPPARTYECELWCRQTSRMIAGCVGVCCLAAAYAALGGLLFMAVESRAAVAREEGELVMVGSAAAVASRNSSTVISSLMDSLPTSTRTEVSKARAETVERLWMVTERMNILYPENWTRRAAEEMLWFQDQLVKAFAREFRELRSQASKQLDGSVASHGGDGMASTTAGPVAAFSKKWTFSRGLLYAVSLLTTVGKSSTTLEFTIY